MSSTQDPVKPRPIVPMIRDHLEMAKRHLDSIKIDITAGAEVDGKLIEDIEDKITKLEHKPCDPDRG